MKPLALAFALAFALPACSDAGGTASPPLVRDSAGIAIVQNTAPVWATDEQWSVAPEPMLDIGVLEGAEEYQLFRVSDVTRLPGGEILLANNGPPEFRVYGPDGTYRFSGGREGEGPGEFANVAAVYSMEGDSVLVYDNRLGRVSIFDAEGDFARSFQLAALSTDGSVTLEDRFEDGDLLLSVRDRLSPANLSTGLMRDTSVYVRYDPMTERVDTVARLPGRESLVQIGQSGSNMTVQIMRTPFLRAAHVATAGNRAYLGASDRYELGIYDENLDLVRLTRREHTLSPVEGEYMEASLAARRADAEAEGEPVPGNPFEGLPLPETLPAFSDLVADAEGNLWVERFLWPGDEQPRWDVFDPDGVWLGTVETPPRFRIEVIGSDYLLGIWTDEFDVQHVRLYGLEKP